MVLIICRAVSLQAGRLSQVCLRLSLTNWPNAKFGIQSSQCLAAWHEKKRNTCSSCPSILLSNCLTNNAVLTPLAMNISLKRKPWKSFRCCIQMQFLQQCWIDLALDCQSTALKSSTGPCLCKCVLQSWMLVEESQDDEVKVAPEVVLWCRCILQVAHPYAGHPTGHLIFLLEADIPKRSDGT